MMMNMVLKELEIGSLKVNPENKKYFTDIKLTHPEFWKDMVGNVAEKGILEPIIVNRAEMRIISGHQRVLAAKEVGLEKVPCILVDVAGEEDELQRLLAANIYRRPNDPVTLMRLMGAYRESYEKRRNAGSLGSDTDVREELRRVFGKHTDFMRAADLFNALPKKKQKELTDWIKENDPSDKEIKGQVEKMRLASLTDKTTIKGLSEAIKERDDDINRLNKSLAGAVTIEAFEKLKEQIKVLAREKKDLGIALKAKEDENKEYNRQTSKIIRASKLIEEIQTTASSTAAKINSFMELMDDVESLGGLDMAIVQERLKELLSTIKAFVERWSKKSSDVRRITK